VGRVGAVLRSGDYSIAVEETFYRWL